MGLARPLEPDDGLRPRGATGTVVHVHPAERAYDMEFQVPFHTVATVRPEDVRCFTT